MSNSKMKNNSTININRLHYKDIRVLKQKIISNPLLDPSDAELLSTFPYVAHGKWILIKESPNHLVILNTRYVTRFIFLIPSLVPAFFILLSLIFSFFFLYTYFFDLSSVSNQIGELFILDIVFFFLGVIIFFWTSSEAFNLWNNNIVKVKFDLTQKKAFFITQRQKSVQNETFDFIEPIFKLDWFFPKLSYDETSAEWRLLLINQKIMNNGLLSNMMNMLTKKILKN